jgi:hypothetical protein
VADRVACDRAAGAGHGGAARLRAALPRDGPDHRRDGVHGRGVRQRRGSHGSVLRPARAAVQRRLGRPSRPAAGWPGCCTARGTGGHRC